MWRGGKKMKIAMIGLGRMGMNMAKRLLQGGHEVVAYNRTPQKTDEIVREGAIGAYSLEEVVEKLTAPRVVWIMLPAGSAVDEHMEQFKDILSKGDIVVDGGNTYYKDDIRRAELLSEKGIQFMDAGVSGGIWGLGKGYCLMVGGEKEPFHYLEPIFKTLSPDEGYLYCGATGAGHFVKMVHNGIEYGLMQAYAEGFEIMKTKQDFDLDLHQIAEIWRYGSVVRSWLLDLTANALADDQELSDIQAWVADSGEGRWMVADAIDLDVPAPVITLSLLMRFVSRQEDSYAARMLAAMRQQFGGHAVKRST